MLAVLFVVIWFAVYGMCILGEIGDVFRNAPVVPLGIFIDYSVATLLLTANIRFLYGAGWLNWVTLRR